MSAFSSIADIQTAACDVRKVPIAEVPAQRVVPESAMETGSTGLGLRGKEFASFGFLSVTVAAILLLGCGLLALVII
jgi:hypothetical protein